jgi:hypothetical protein
MYHAGDHGFDNSGQLPVATATRYSLSLETFYDYHLPGGSTRPFTLKVELPANTDEPTARRACEKAFAVNSVRTVGLVDTGGSTARLLDVYDGLWKSEQDEQD